MMRTHHKTYYPPFVPHVTDLACTLRIRIVNRNKEQCGEKRKQRKQGVESWAILKIYLTRLQPRNYW